MAESIDEEEAPPEGKERERCCWERNGHHGRRQDGAGPAPAVGMGNGILALPRQAAAPRPRSRVVKRTLSFRLDNII